MDAKHIIPVLSIRGPHAAAGGGAGDASRAGRVGQLEREGADGVLFQASEPGDLGPWLGEAAASLALPILVEAPFRTLAEVGGALEAGADKVVLAAAGVEGEALLEAAALVYGRSRVAVAVQAFQDGAGSWRIATAGGADQDALERLAGLAQRGAGEILLRLGTEGEAAAPLLQGAARLSLPVLSWSRGDTAAAAEALLNGADGLAFPAQDRSASEWKSALTAYGLTMRF